MAAVGDLRERFRGRTCVVTGGGRGIGRAIAVALAGEGASVGVVARTRSECEEVAASIGERALAFDADVTDPEACRRAVGAIADRFGRPSLLVNSAGVSPVRERAENHDPEVFRHILDVNLAGVFTMTHAMAPILLDGGGGAVVNIASTLGTAATPRLAGYGASKAGVMHLTRTLAREWGARGVRVNAVCPSYTETEMTSALLAVEHLRAEIIDDTPMGRLATIEEIVAPTLFLASDEASFITGASLLVDGGMSA